MKKQREDKKDGEIETNLEPAPLGLGTLPTSTLWSWVNKLFRNPLTVALLVSSFEDKFLKIQENFKTCLTQKHKDLAYNLFVLVYQKLLIYTFKCFNPNKQIKQKTKYKSRSKTKKD